MSNERDKNTRFAQAMEAPSDPKERLHYLEQKLDVQIPIESIPLPSRGKVYGIDTALGNLETVEIKSMTAKEEAILASPSLLKSNKVLDELIKSCVLTPGVAPLIGELLAGDKNALLIGIRISGYGPDYPCKLLCPECNKEFKTVAVLNNLKIKELTAHPIIPNSNLFEFMLPVSKKLVKFKLLTGKDSYEIERMITEQEKHNPTQVSPGLLLRLKKSVVEFGGETDRTMIGEKVENLIARDSLELRQHIEKIQPDVEMTIKADCPHCGNLGMEVAVDIGPSFFWPQLPV